MNVQAVIATWLGYDLFVVHPDQEDHEEMLYPLIITSENCFDQYKLLRQSRNFNKQINACNFSKIIFMKKNNEEKCITFGKKCRKSLSG